MKKGMRFIVCVLLAVLLPLHAAADFPVETTAKSALLMDADTGTVLLELNADEQLPLASVTKVMTMLLCMEALQGGKITMDDMVTASPYACSMGGSQIYLEPGEQMSVSDMLKAIAVASANDACVAMAEHIMGSADAFVEAMNDRAQSLGMQNTHFVNCNGLDAENHYSSARDVAIMSRELLKHQEILPYLSIWMDSLRDGAFGLANTNKLIRTYPGAIGVKTGSTSNAKYCLSAAAQRDGLTLVAAVLGAETTADRFATASALLDYGFANYKISTLVEAGEVIETIDVQKGVVGTVEVKTQTDYKRLMAKNSTDEIERVVLVPDSVKAPVLQNDLIGELQLLQNGEELCRMNLVAAADVPRLGVADLLVELLNRWMCY